MFLLCALLPAVSLLAGSREEAEKIALNASYIPLVGQWEARVDQPFEDVVKGFESALAQMDYVLTKDKVKDEHAAVLTFRGAEDVKVVIKVKDMDSFTNVKIFYGNLGDKEKSSTLFIEAYTRF